MRAYYSSLRLVKLTVLFMDYSLYSKCNLGIKQRWECARVDPSQFSFVYWLCCWFSLLKPRSFLWNLILWFSALLKTYTYVLPKTPFRFGKHKHIAEKVFSRLSYLYTYPLQIKIWLTDLPTDWLTHWLTHWLTGCLTPWLTDWLTDWLAGWLTDCRKVVSLSEN